MTRRYVNQRFAPDPYSPAFRAVVASSLWLRMGFVTLSVAAIALILLATGDATPGIASSTAVAGGAVTAFAWRRARAILDDIDAAFTVGARVPAAAPITRHAGAFVAGVESAASR